MLEIRARRKPLVPLPWSTFKGIARARSKRFCKASESPHLSYHAIRRLVGARGQVLITSISMQLRDSSRHTKSSLERRLLPILA